MGAEPVRVGPAPRLRAENLRAWDVLSAAFAGRQFLFAPLGGVIAFNYEAVLRMIDVMVPASRRLEVFTKFRWVEQFAINAVAVKRTGGGDAKGTDAAVGGKGRRNRRAS